MVYRVFVIALLFVQRSTKTTTFWKALRLLRPIVCITEERENVTEILNGMKTSKVNVITS